MKHPALLIIGPLLMLLTTVTAAAPPITKYSDAELVSILKSEGYGAIEVPVAGTIIVKIDGQGYALINNYDGDLQTYYSISGTKISYEDINDWNKTKRLSRAYLDADTDPVLESDLLANAGLSPKQVTEFFKVFVDSAKFFRQFISEHNTK